MITLCFMFVPRLAVYAVNIPASATIDVITSVIKFNLRHNVVLVSIN